jgi:hypothetical protein
MARRYTSVPGIGRCSIVLEGHDEEQQRRARLVFQIETGRVFLVTTPASSVNATPVTQYPTSELLDHLSAFTWWLPLGPVLAEGDED